MKVLCTICARGGSQGVKNKNIISLCGKPLIAHSILQAKESTLFDYIAVSSDSKKIRDIALKWGADFVVERPAELATATAAKLPAIQHVVCEIEYKMNIQFDIVLDLDATSPLRTVQDVTESFHLFVNNKSASNLITGSPARRSPYFNLVEMNENGFVALSKKIEVPVLRRQDSPACYDLNASIYIWRRDFLFQHSTVISDKTLFFTMPEERSVDIDSPLDLKIVKLLARSRKDFQ